MSTDQAAEQGTAPPESQAEQAAEHGGSGPDGQPGSPDGRGGTGRDAGPDPRNRPAGRGWPDEKDAKAVDLARALAMDAVEAVGSGHPGTAMSLAPVAYLIYQELLRQDPTDVDWSGRDRFVLSCGHSSLTQYVQLYLAGYGLELDDLAAYRTWGSLTPGHPEHGHTVGIDITTGPLGQGISSAVGMAMAARRERGLYDPEPPPGESIFDHTVWVIASDGDMQEGVQAEAASLAGHQRLGSLVVLYDDNHISIEGDTSVAFSEDVLARYEAYGWHTQRVDDSEDVEALRAALTTARDTLDRPSIVAMRSIIAWPAPKAQNTGKSHGAALGAEEVAATKEALGLDPAVSFAMPPEILEHTRKAVDRGRARHAEWDERHAQWAQAHPEEEALRQRVLARRLPSGWEAALPTFEPSEKGVATRSASGSVLDALAPVLPELWGGSADLAGSNNTTMKGEPSFLPVPSDQGGPYGRILHFGIREHAMGAVMNGIALASGLRVYGGTFLVFSDYMRAAVRMAAIMKLPVTYVWTHDSIGLGEDGPTHQPVEHLAALRAMPGLDVVRPADANEVVVAWRTVLEQVDRPAGLCLSRQNLPVLDRSPGSGIGSAENVSKGGYVLAEAGSGRPQVLLLATGSEVSIAMAARELLEADGVSTRVVSVPCREWFDAQEPSYRASVLPPDVRARVSVEAGVAQGWRELVGEDGECVSLEHFGASASYQKLYEEFGFTPERVAAAARTSLATASRRAAAPS